MASVQNLGALAGAPVEVPRELPAGWRWERLGRYSGNRSQSVDPAKAPDQEFELFSVPSFDVGSPERVSGRSIGSSKQFVSGGDVLLCKINPRINRVWVVGPSTGLLQIASTEWIRFPPNAEVLPEFLGHYLRLEQLRAFLAMNVSGVGGSLMRVKARTLADYPVPIPPLDIQRRIVARIDELFTELVDGEAALARARDDLETYRKSLLRSAFMGELTADWRAAHPTIETGQQLLQRILADRRNRWEADPKNRGKRFPLPAVPSALSEIPANWTTADLETLSVEPSRNGLSVKEATEPTEVRALRLNALSDGGVRWENHRFLPRRTDEVTQYTLRSGDLLVSRANGSPKLVGRCSLVLEPPVGMIFPDTIIRYRLGGDHVVWQWIALMWGAPPVRQQLLSLAKSTAGILKVSQGDIRRVGLPLPPHSEMAAAVALVSSCLEEANDGQSATELQAAHSGQLRQSILNAAFRGELVQ
ncbi:restriction endonuclease subunit S [Altererythrobacter sp. TH136]|uniref:restriction endonuclease subunit S n=1 Tax=Altererythrobacter sp. TH136 TaxID=2067415 RepID=UPI0011631CC0|nr:restriction endonuclease subunit S [Altererythrobacter sp. TH136]QDM40617.1 hypothetical protein C0V74_05850 [Altererythrobacter sp. TH136]